MLKQFNHTVFISHRHFDSIINKQIKSMLNVAKMSFDHLESVVICRLHFSRIISQELAVLCIMKSFMKYAQINSML